MPHGRKTIRWNTITYQPFAPIVRPTFRPGRLPGWRCAPRRGCRVRVIEGPFFIPGRAYFSGRPGSVFSRTPPKLHSSVVCPRLPPKGWSPVPAEQAGRSSRSAQKALSSAANAFFRPLQRLPGGLAFFFSDRRPHSTISRTSRDMPFPKHGTASGVRRCLPLPSVRLIARPCRDQAGAKEERNRDAKGAVLILG